MLAGFREREKPYIADIRQCEILPETLAALPRNLAALVETLSIREKTPPGGGCGGRPRDRARVSSSGAARRRRCEKIAAFGAEQGVQIFLQTGGLDTVRPLHPHYPPLTYAVDEGRVTIEFGPVDFIQVNREVNASMVAAAMALLQPSRGDPCSTCFAAWAISPCPWRAARSTSWASKVTRRCLPKPQAMPLATGSTMPSSSRRICSSRTLRAVGGPPLRPGTARPAASRCVRTARALGALASAATRVYFLPSGELGAGCRNPGSHQGFKLSCAGVMDMFPHTTHVESVAVFESPA